MLVESVEGVSDKTAEDEWPLILSDTFKLLSSENIDAIEHQLRHMPLNDVLDLNAFQSAVSTGNVRSRSSIASLVEGKDCWNGWLLSTESSDMNSETSGTNSPPLLLEVTDVQSENSKKRKKRSTKSKKRVSRTKSSQKLKTDEKSKEDSTKKRRKHRKSRKEKSDQKDASKSKERPKICEVQK